MKRRTIPRVLSIISCVGLVALLAALLPSPAPANAAPAAPQVAVYLKNYHEEYDLATTEFLAGQFDDLDSPAYGVISYTVVSTLTQEALAGSTALVIDESADMSLSDSEAALIDQFVKRGGKVGLFTFPRYNWDHVGPNPAAYQGVADLFGISAIGDPAAADLASEHSAANVLESTGQITLTTPYTLAEQVVETYDQLPFTPITAVGSTAVMTSTALAGAPVAVINSNGLLVTNSIGDLVQGRDANTTYGQFVVDAMVWLAKNGSLTQYRTYLPMTLQ
jgi:hypothetical protein